MSNMLRLRGRAEMARFKNPSASYEQIAASLGVPPALVRVLLVGDDRPEGHGLSQFRYPCHDGDSE